MANSIFVRPKCLLRAVGAVATLIIAAPVSAEPILVGVQIQAQVQIVNSQGEGVTVSECNGQLEGPDVTWSPQDNPCIIEFPQGTLDFGSEGSLSHGRMRTRVWGSLDTPSGYYTTLDGLVTMQMSEKVTYTLNSAGVLFEGNTVARTASPVIGNSGRAGVSAPCNRPGGCDEGRAQSQTKTILVRGDGTPIDSTVHSLVNTDDPENSAVSSADYEDLISGILSVQDGSFELAWTFTNSFYIGLRDDVHGGSAFETDFSHTVELWDIRLFNSDGIDVTALYDLSFENGTELGARQSLAAPTPASMALLGLGLLGIGVARRTLI